MGIFVTILIMIILFFCVFTWVSYVYQVGIDNMRKEQIELTAEANYQRGKAESNEKWGAAVGNQNAQIVNTILGRMDLNKLPEGKEQESNSSPSPIALAQNMPNDAQNAGTEGRGDAMDARTKVDRRDLERKFSASKTVESFGKFENRGDIMILTRTADGAKFWCDLPKPYDNEGNINKKLNAFRSDDDLTIKLFMGWCQVHDCNFSFITQSEDGRFCSDTCRKKHHKQSN